MARAQLPAMQQRRISFTLADVNDIDLVSLLEASLTGNMSAGWGLDSHTGSTGGDGPAFPAADAGDGGLATTARRAHRAFASLLIFCNNVAFNEGTIHRCCLPFALPRLVHQPQPQRFMSQCRVRLTPARARLTIREPGSHRWSGQPTHCAARFDRGSPSKYTASRCQPNVTCCFLAHHIWCGMQAGRQGESRAGAAGFAGRPSDGSEHDAAAGAGAVQEAGGRGPVDDLERRGASRELRLLSSLTGRQTAPLRCVPAKNKLQLGAQQCLRS